MTHATTFWVDYQRILGEVTKLWPADRRQRLYEQAAGGRAVADVSRMPRGQTFLGPDPGPHLDYRMLLFAAIKGQLIVVRFLLAQGADPAAEVLCDDPVADGNFSKGWRALHCASAAWEPDIIGVLLAAGAHPDVGDSRGRTPLMAACSSGTPSTPAAIKTVKALLGAGACASFADNSGRCALHLAASSGIDPDVIGLLVWKSPCTLNHADNDGKTPLWYAANSGHESAVERLLYAGAKNDNRGQANCPLSAAVLKGHEGVVGILLDEGIEAIGGFLTLSHSVHAAVKERRTRILHALLTTPRKDPNISMELLLGCTYWCFSLLHHAVGFGNLPGTSALLSAGMHETGYDAIGSYLPAAERDTATESAIGRTLLRGPAFRARSWLWPGPARSVAAADAAGTAGFAPGVNICRPSNDRFFMRAIGRYATRP
ncbi:unnamed protein product [Scytosiphon promiscuus]